MKQRIALLFMGGFLVLSQTACRKVVGHGPVVPEIRSLSGVQQIDLMMDARVEVTQDSVYFLEVLAQADIQDEVLTQQDGTTLKIKSRSNVWIKSEDITIKVHLPKVNSLEVSGSGILQGMGGIQTQALDLVVSGSGEINLPTLQAQMLDADISGSGKVTVSAGSCPETHTQISGSGSIRVSGMQSDRVHCKTSGSGLTRVWASQTLYADISGSGDVLYRGNPVIETHVSGSGSVKPE